MGLARLAAAVGLVLLVLSGPRPTRALFTATSAPSGSLGTNASFAPELQVAPSFSGSLVTGALLTASAGTWRSNLAVSSTYLWQLCTPSCVTVGTGATLTLPLISAGGIVKLTVTATNAQGSTSSTVQRTA